MKLLSLLFVLPFCLVFNQAKAQTFTEKDIIGNWTVIEVLSSKPNNDTEKKVVAGFKNSTFVFNTDHTFELKSTDKSIYITMLSRQLVKAQWMYFANNNEIKIGTPQNNYSILNIEMQHKGEATQFILKESNISLVVKKN
jgi:hypothetical protein